MNDNLGTRGSRDEARGASDKLSGRLQRFWGRLIGNKRMEAEGTARQAKGTMQSTTGKAERKVDETLRS
jgi:uncharacterized protein YjbJ (UPF0337 family)